MDVIYGLIPGMILLGVVMLIVLFWAARSGQFEDLDGEAFRILMDDERPKQASAPEAQPEASTAENITTATEKGNNQTRS